MDVPRRKSVSDRSENEYIFHVLGCCYQIVTRCNQKQILSSNLVKRSRNRCATAAFGVLSPACQGLGFGVACGRGVE